ncbi:hypothetical protein C8R32_108132 [Nitrosospira sp. Nsp5]|uniref:Uncharacterized protein n=1 Tax=Nitrosospira multiformis TaxID=1231 RepID=A0ABY0T6Q4_9PROT|nr:hypothetical protein C8R32_108132 [Nitrosospira sp. Nsp5]SDQ35100.1 hypothetical protein SAMN05216402_0510 [Nitrosospira multiformis]
MGLIIAYVTQRGKARENDNVFAMVHGNVISHFYPMGHLVERRLNRERMHQEISGRQGELIEAIYSLCI